MSVQASSEYSILLYISSRFISTLIFNLCNILQLDTLLAGLKKKSVVLDSESCKLGTLRCEICQGK